MSRLGWVRLALLLIPLALAACGDSDAAGPNETPDPDAGPNGGVDADAGSMVAGCTDDDADNFSADATIDDGGCVYAVTFTVDLSGESGAEREAFVAVDESRDPLTDLGGGAWRGTVVLAPGTYAYRYELGSPASDRAPVRRFELVDAPLSIDDGVFGDIAASLPMIVSDHFEAAGIFPGDGDQTVGDACPDRPSDAVGDCYRFEYAERGGEAFAGVLWTAGPGFQDPQPTVRVEPGATQVRFVAWGEVGGEVVEFGVKPNDEDGNPQPQFTLTDAPAEYAVDFGALTYDRVIFPFLWAAGAADNPGPITFYVTDIRWTAPGDATRGCTDPDAKNHAADATLDDGSCTYDLSFVVDMGCPDAVDANDNPIGEVTGFADVAITGPQFGFAPDINMTPGADGTYSITLTDLNLPDGRLEYLYITDEFTSKERLFDEVGSCGLTLNNPTPTIANRVVDAVSGQTYRDVYGQCGACPAIFSWTLGDAIDTAQPGVQTLVQATGQTHPIAPSATWDDVPGPYPTNAWWLSAATGDEARPLNVLPNQVRAASDRLWLGPTGEFNDVGVSIFSEYRDEIALGASEAVTARRIADYDLLSLTLTWATAGGGTMSAPLVRGSPYLTMLYDEATPVLTAGSAITAFSGSGDRYEVTLANGARFIIYTSPALELTRSGDSLRAGAPFTGAIRVARSGSQNAVLDAHRDAIPLGGVVSASIVEDAAEVSFDWVRQGSGPLLMMTLPHHRDTLVSPTTTALTDTTLRGPMVGVTGDRWTMRWTLPPLDFQAQRPIDPAFVNDIRSALAAEKSARPTTPWDTYFFGTQVGRMTRLLLIAEELGDQATATELTNALKDELAPWVAGTNPDPLVYDATWGGIVTEAAPFDTLAQFGSGVYNDHHFHFGYHVYAAAAVARRDPAWTAANGDFYRTLIRDFANPSEADPYFTRFRNFDWFVGHSWAAGILQRDFGRDQESTSEAAFSYYAVKLFGDATGDDNLTGLGWLLSSLEMRSAQRYWQMKTPSEIYPDRFAALGVVGILYSFWVRHETFFGNNLEFIFGIQVVPITPMTEPLIDPVWAEDVWPVVSPALTRTDPVIGVGWKLVLAALRGTHDVSDASTLVESPMGEFDNGRSEANLWWWLATRP